MSSLIVVELRLAFRTCAKPRSSPQLRQSFFSTHRYLQDRRAAQSPAPSNPKTKPKLSIAKRPDATVAKSQDTKDALPAAKPKEGSKDVGPAPRSYRDVETGKQVPVPMKVLPKAHLTPDLVLNAKERMQLEYITRRLPKREPGQVFRERLLIYHRGLSKTNWTVFIKVCTMVGMAFATCIAAPAYYTFGAPWFTVASILVVGCSPFLAFTWRTRPLVTWIFLILPTFARQSPKAALEYARNLPDSARLQIHYMRTSGLPANVTVEMRDLKPVRSTLRPVTFEWTGNRVDKGALHRPNLTEFFVKEKSGTGKEKRDIIPGIWEPVYKRIMGAESESDLEHVIDGLLQSGPPSELKEAYAIYCHQFLTAWWNVMMATKYSLNLWTALARARLLISHESHINTAEHTSPNHCNSPAVTRSGIAAKVEQLEQKLPPHMQVDSNTDVTNKTAKNTMAYVDELQCKAADTKKNRKALKTMKKEHDRERETKVNCNESGAN